MKERDEIMNLREAADYAHITRGAIYMTVRNKLVKSHKIKNKLYIRKSDLDEYRLSKFNGDARKHQGQYIFDIEEGRLSIHQIVKLYKIPKQHLYYILRRGYIKAHRVGAAWLIMKEDIEDYILRKTEKDTQQLRFA